MNKIGISRGTEENELLVVSFGTTSADSRRLNIDSVEHAIRDAVGDKFCVRRCFTSQTIINIINKKENVRIDNVTEALERAVQNGVKNLVVQPTHLMKGFEYDKLRSILSEHSDSFEKISLGEPLLSSEEDLTRVAEALIESCSIFDDGETAIVFMGHGTGAAANNIYDKMQNMFAAKGKNNYFVGTVEAEPSLEEVIAKVKEHSFRKVVIRPMMLVAGNHAINDMAAAEDPESWYSRFTAAGYETECIIEGLGQLKAIRDIYADHALRSIDDSGISR